MWIHKGDTLTKGKEVIEVMDISGLYASAQNMTIRLKNQATQEEETLNFFDFSQKVENKELVPFEFSKKVSRVY